VVLQEAQTDLCQDLSEEATASRQVVGNDADVIEHSR
jgi:hypothetical protein